MRPIEPNHFFRLEEVNALIPQLEGHFQNFWALRQNAQDILQRLRKKVKETFDQTPKETAYQQMKQSQAHFLLEQAKRELDAIIEIGGVIKDLEIGLVDFFHLPEHADEEVYLCWRYGERKVRFWHGVDEGFTARKPLVRKAPFH